MTWVTSEAQMIKLDYERDGAIIEGSRNLLKALWEHHPRTLRIAYSQGRAKTVKEVMAATELKAIKRKLFEKANCISDRIEVRKQITPAEVAEIIEVHQPARQPETGMKLVQSVAHCMGITYGELIGDGRSRRYVEARVVVVAVLRERSWSFPKISRLLGKRDHSTIRHAMDIFETYAKRNPMVMELFLRFRPDAVVT